MKLKLETENEITVLVVLEAVETKQIAVLRAGLKKLFESQKKVILVDFMGVPESAFQQDPNLAAELAKLSAWAQELGIQLVSASIAKGSGGLPSRAAAIEYLRNPLARLLANENNLNQEVRAAEQLKAEIEKKLQSAAADIARMRKLKNENTELKKVIAMLEESLSKQLSKRTRPAEPMPSAKQKLEKINNLLVTVLEQEGAIAPK